MRILSIIGIGIVLALLGYALYQYETRVSAADSEESERVVLAPSVNTILAENIFRIEQLFSDPTIIAATNASNDKTAGLSADQIAALDARWLGAVPEDPFIQQYLTNDVARVLKAFQQQYPEYKEIFVADRYGINVGQTNKTSDLYQADESWWIEGYANGEGRSFHGEIEFDASSQTEAISLYVPIRVNGRAIGVGKAVLDLNAIAERL